MIGFNLEDDDEIAAAQKKSGGDRKDRIVRVPIPLPMLVLFFTTNQVLKIDGLPPDTTYAGWSFDPERQDIIYLFVVSKEFEEINYGDFIPLWDKDIEITKENYDMQKLAEDVIKGK